MAHPISAKISPSLPLLLTIVPFTFVTSSDRDEINDIQHSWQDGESAFTYELGEWETMILDLISRQVPSVPIQAFSDDPQLYQKVDRGNKISLYFDQPPGGQAGSSSTSALGAKEIYRRKNVDAKLPVIVLRSGEDHLPLFERKRTFVVLRQNPETNNTYFASYAYLR